MFLSLKNLEVGERKENPSFFFSCGLSPATISLLPSKSVFPEEAEADVVFDGVTNAVIVPPQHIPGELTTRTKWHAFGCAPPFPKS